MPVDVALVVAVADEAEVMAVAVADVPLLL